MSTSNQTISFAKQKRKEWAISDAKRDDGLIEPDDIIKIRNLNYFSSDESDKDHLFDIYYPSDYEKIEKFPVIVSIHGGGWFYGDKELYRFYCMSLAEYGFAVVNFNYRLSPENKYPAGFMDVCSLMEHIEANRVKYKIDISKLFVVGDSAGAQLCSQYCVWATNREYHRLLDPDLKMSSPVPKAVALNCGIYDMREMVGRDEICEWYLPNTFDRNSNVGKSYFDIIDYIDNSFPDAYVMTSYNDALKVATPVLVSKLKEKNIHYIYKEYAINSPGDGHVFHVDMKSEEGRICNEDEIAFFKSR